MARPIAFVKDFGAVLLKFDSRFKERYGVPLKDVDISISTLHVLTKENLRGRATRSLKGVHISASLSFVFTENGE